MTNFLATLFWPENLICNLLWRLKISKSWLYVFHIYKKTTWSADTEDCLSSSRSSPMLGISILSRRSTFLSTGFLVVSPLPPILGISILSRRSKLGFCAAVWSFSVFSALLFDEFFLSLDPGGAFISPVFLKKIKVSILGVVALLEWLHGFSGRSGGLVKSLCYVLWFEDFLPKNSVKKHFFFNNKIILIWFKTRLNI